jgi:hypothetical protein
MEYWENMPCIHSATIPASILEAHSDNQTMFGTAVYFYFPRRFRSDCSPFRIRFFFVIYHTTLFLKNQLNRISSTIPSTICLAACQFKPKCHAGLSPLADRLQHVDTRSNKSSEPRRLASVLEVDLLEI